MSHFSYLEYASSSEISISFPRKIVDYAKAVVSNCTGTERQSMAFLQAQSMPDLFNMSFFSGEVSLKC